MAEPVNAGRPGGREAAADVHVVTIAYNPDRRELATFAATLADATAARVRLTIVDNGRAHEAVDEVAAAHGAEVVRPGANLGYGTAANLGARGGVEPWLVVVNTDVEWRAGSLDTLLEAGERHARAGALGPTILNLDGTVYASARALPSLVVGGGHAVLAPIWPGNPFTARYQQRSGMGAREERAVGWLSGACLLLRRSAFDAVGGFDEGYFMFFEDTDLGDRLARAGWDNVYVPSAQVVHDQGASWRERPAPMVRAHHRSAERYLRARYDAWWQLPVRSALAGGLRARARLLTRHSGE
ncbi:glycosyltransferase [Georgenia sp. Z1491]|uniref:glycosyltransferase n=1 Tax=Georgenia sp. Z1491 TaxID=3416707 RepID=UPI003CE92023